jgi:outer membrane lipoprotein SlyB
MNNNVIRSTHPLVIIAAISLTLFSFAGIAAIMGWLPSSKGQVTEPTAATSALSAAAEPAAKPGAKVESAMQPREVKSASREPVRRTQHRETVFSDAPKTVRSEPQVVAQADAPPPAPRVIAEPPKAICHNCGVIETVRAIEQEAKPSGLGAAAGGVLGGVVGHQMGNGRGRDLMTVVGAVGGAVAGHQVEKQTRKTTSYEIVVRFDDGTTQRLSETQAPTWKAGDRVRMVNGQLRALEA